MIRFAALLCALLFLSLPAFAQAPAKQAMIGDAEIVLPQMPGMVEVLGRNDKFDALVRQFVPATNRLVAVYLSDSDIGAVDSGEGGIDKYILIQTPKSGLRITGPDDFNAVRTEIIRGAVGGDADSAEAVQKHLDDASGYISNTYHRRTKLQVGETRSLGAFMNNEGAFGLALIANVGVQGEDGSLQDLSMASGIVALNVKSQMVFANIYSQYKGEADANFVRDTGLAYAKLVFAANGQGELKEAATPAPTPEEAAAASSLPVPDTAINAALGVTFALCVGILLFYLVPVFRKLRGKKDDVV